MDRGGHAGFSQDAVRKQEFKCSIEGLEKRKMASTLKKLSADTPASSNSSPASPPPCSPTWKEVNTKPQPVESGSSAEFLKQEAVRNRELECTIERMEKRKVAPTLKEAMYDLLGNTPNPPPGSAAPSLEEVNTQPQPVIRGGHGGFLLHRAAPYIMTGPTVNNGPQRPPSTMYAVPFYSQAAYHQGQVRYWR